jgi:hypothetical protein
MSTVIIAGGGGKAAINNLVLLYPRMTAQQQAKAVALLQKFIEDAAELVGETQDGD